MIVCLLYATELDSQSKQRENAKLTNSKAESTNVQEGADYFVVVMKLLQWEWSEGSSSLINYYKQLRKQEDLISSVIN
jgi:hypothetical protein